jgi:hypothetical protein
VSEENDAGTGRKAEWLRTPGACPSSFESMENFFGVLWNIPVCIFVGFSLFPCMRHTPIIEGGQRKP